jgi:hypothetical protein
MRTRRSWRNQERIHKMLSKGDWQTVTGPQPKPEPKPPKPILTDTEIDAMWWMGKQSRRMAKLDAAKQRRESR